ncbi:hypothetical protein ACLOJK_018656, partial [Asimina triloba]
MGRKKDKATRRVTFTKRRHGLFKKAGELCVLCDAEVAVLTFSPAGKPFTFSHPSIDSLLCRLSFDLPAPIDCSTAAIPTSNPQLQPHVHGSSNGGPSGYWWELVNVDDFVDESDLHRLKNALEGLRQGVYARLAGDLVSCNESALVTQPSLPGGVSSSSLPGTTAACHELCGGLSEFLQGNFGGPTPDFEISDNLPQVTD